jgi:4-amino-4-deoxy-L-arabinose transferase-like glycosyltransferase
MNSQNIQISQNFDSIKYPLLITLVFSLVMGYLVFFQNDYLKDGDFFHYFLYGEQILNGDGKNVSLFNAGPGGPILYASLNKVFGDAFLTSKVITLLSATGIVFLSYYVIRNIFDSKIGLVGQILVAVNPRFDIVSIQALNELFPVFLIFISFYFITKKNLKLSDIIISGFILGLASMVRFQPILILFSFIIFLLIRNKDLKKNFLYAIILSVIFLLAFSPSIYYNYTTHGTFIDSNPNYEYLLKSKYKTPSLIEELKKSISLSENLKIFVDFKLFLQNYFYNLLYHNPDKLFNFNSISNVSLTPTIPFLGLVPVLGGLLYLLKIYPNKKNILILISSVVISIFLIFLFGDIHIHFFAIVIVPILVFSILYFRNVNENLLPLLIASMLFLSLISILPLSRPDHLFPIWIIIPILGSIFLVKIVPQLFQKIKSFRRKESIFSHEKKVIVIFTSLIILLNLGHSYKTLENYLYEGSYNGVWNEINELIHRDESLVQSGAETKKIAEVLSAQQGIERSYVMSIGDTYLYYVDTKIILTTYQEGEKGDPIEKFITRENWSDFDIYMSNVNSFPADRHGLYNPIPDYLIYGNIPISGWKYDINSTQYEDLKILSDPNNPKIPSYLEVLYKSNKSDIVVYKINHEK